MKNVRLIMCTLAALGVAACASTPSPELVSARNAYSHAAAGPAASAAPADLHIAKMALSRAESAYSSGSSDQRDFAYVAQRKAELAEVVAMRAGHVDARESAEAKLAEKKDENSAETKAELERTKDNLAGAQQNATDSKRNAADADARAADANARAAESDARVKGMQLELAKWAAVREEARGVVITLSGSVLFASDKAALLPAARTRLGQVTAALLATKERHLDVQGYTDSQGTDAHNIDLSQRRADAVRLYLVSNGYPPDLVLAHGAGKTLPVADNGTAEGRANNRRVEIVIEPERAVTVR